ncbi:unnamed protein product [Bathycoccus prasinos]
MNVAQVVTPEDGSAKIFDVNSFDMIGMIQLKKKDDENNSEATCIAWFYDSRKKDTHEQRRSGRITVHDANAEDLNQTMVKELTSVHGGSNGVVCMAYNGEYECVVSCDQSGGVEAWSADPEEEFER